jgi:hypothetical protein
MKNDTRTTMSVMALIAGIIFLAAGVGCAKEPAVEITAARDAIQKAQTAEAEQYASPALAAAQDAQARLDAELKAQAEKFALFRSYAQTAELAQAAAKAAQNAETEAAQGKETARGEAETAITNARAAIDRAKLLLAQAPVGKGSQADIQAMTNDITGMEQSLADITAVYESQSYKEAKAKAVALEQSATRMEGELMTAIETWKSASK